MKIQCLEHLHLIFGPSGDELCFGASFVFGARFRLQCCSRPRSIVVFMTEFRPRLVSLPQTPSFSSLPSSSSEFELRWRDETGTELPGSRRIISDGSNSFLHQFYHVLPRIGIRTYSSYAAASTTASLIVVFSNVHSPLEPWLPNFPLHPDRNLSQLY